MHPVFSKPLDTVTAEDIASLVAEGYPEDAAVEFKERIPHKGGRDTWYEDGGIGDYGRNQILEEVVALANTHGGHVVLGIQESSGPPHRAVGIEPIPRCAALADVLRKQIRDCIEPKIPIIAAQGILVRDDSGVVVIRVPQSPRAPHRLNATRECYFRHADRTERMTMREIQDLTLQRSQGAQGLDKLFEARSAEFHNWLFEAHEPQQIVVGGRITLIPTTELYAKDVFRKHELFVGTDNFNVHVEPDGKIEAFLPWRAERETPIIRGSRRTDYNNPPSLVVELRCDGLLEIRFRDFKTNLNEARIFPAWVLGTACNGFKMADAFRNGVGAPDVEYAYELELAASTTTIPMEGFPRYGRSTLMSANLPKNPLAFPRMSFGTTDEIPTLIELLLRDYCHSCGVDFSYTVKAVNPV